MRNIILLEAEREGYTIDQVRKTMTVRELIEYLEGFDDEDAEVYLSHDRGYTYGGIRDDQFEVAEYDEETDELERE